MKIRTSFTWKSGGYHEKGLLGFYVLRFTSANDHWVVQQIGRESQYLIIENIENERNVENDQKYEENYMCCA